MTDNTQTTDLEDEFASVRVMVRGEHGLHARPAGKLAQKAQSFQAEIFIHTKGSQADAKSILDVLTLAAAPGDTLEIRARGEDADQALDSLRTLFEKDLD